jgi:hypothetical protein
VASDLKQFTQWAESRGWTVTKSKRNSHLRFDRPGHQPVFSSATPGEYRGMKNLRSQLLRSERSAP